MFVVGYSESQQVGLLRWIVTALISDNSADRTAGITAVRKLLRFYYFGKSTVIIAPILSAAISSAAAADPSKPAAAATVGATMSSGTLSRQALTEMATPSLRLLCFLKYFTSACRSAIQRKQYAVAETFSLALVELASLELADLPLEKPDASDDSLTSLPSFQQCQSYLNSSLPLLSSVLQFAATRWMAISEPRKDLAHSACFVDVVSRLAALRRVSPFDLFRACQDSLYPRLMADLLNPARPTLLMEFTEVMLQQQVTAAQFLRQGLPVLLPALFTTKGGMVEHLQFLAYVLRSASPADADGAVSQTQVGKKPVPI